MNITLKQLQTFLAITQHKNLTQASKALCLTKAALSMSLKELENQIDQPLFDRVNNRLILNQAGRRLLPLADELCHRKTDIERLFDTENAFSGRLNIGASDTIGNQILPFLLQDFRMQHPDSTQGLTISNSNAICQKVMDYELDFGLIEGEVQYKQLEIQPWQQDEMCIICSPSHPMAHFNKQNEQILTINQLEKTPWLLRETGSGSREFFLQTIAPHLKHWHISFELNTTEAIINACAANLGFACLSKLSARHAAKNQRVCIIDIPLDMRRQFYIVTHKEKYQSPLMDAFIEYCLASSPII